MPGKKASTAASVLLRPRFAGPIAALRVDGVHGLRMGRVDERDALLAYVEAREGEEPTLVSRRVRNAFADGPLELGQATPHWRGADGYGGASYTMDTQPGGAFLYDAGRATVRARIDVEGHEEAWPGWGAFDAAGDGGMFVVRDDGAGHRLLHRAPAGHIVDFGRLPSTPRVWRLVATEGGGLLLAMQDAETARVLVARDGAVQEGAAFGAPFGFRRPVRRAGGGAYVAVSVREETRVLTLDEAGALVGAPQLFTRAGEGMNAFARAGAGFALAMTGAAFHLVLVDEDHATRTRTPLRIKGHFEASALADNGAGTRLACAYLFQGKELRVVRVVCALAEEEPPLEVVVIQEAARPAKPGRFGTRDDVVRRLRQRRLLAALGRLFGGDDAAIEASGDADAGSYVAYDGAGNHIVAVWSRAGVVALGFDHESPLSEWSLPREARRPGKHLPGVPAALRALVKRAFDRADRLATDGFWIASDGSHGEAERLDVLAQLERDDDAGVWLRGGGRLSAVASRLAASERAEVTAEEAEALLDLVRREDGDVDPRHVDRAVAALGALGVSSDLLRRSGADA